MPRNGSGSFSSSVTFVTEAAAPPIEISTLDTAISDLGDEVTNSIAADGQTNPTANLPMATFRHTGVGNANALQTYASAADVIGQNLQYYVDSGAANAYAITPSPAITAYAEGQRFVFRATNDSTAVNPTLNVNGLGALIIYTAQGAPVAPGDITAGAYYEVVYDANPGTDRWLLMSPVRDNAPKGPVNVSSNTTIRAQHARAPIDILSGTPQITFDDSYDGQTGDSGYIFASTACTLNFNLSPGDGELFTGSGVTTNPTAIAAGGWLRWQYMASSTVFVIGEGIS